MKNNERFGGAWTIEKLDIIYKYLNFYTTALKNKKFIKYYVDGFAGEGTIVLSNGLEIEGSASVALNIDNPFDRYVFIELSEEKVGKLELLKNRNKEKNVKIIKSDANHALQSIVHNTNWKYSRGVFFIDPFATQTDWQTLECIASSGCIDVWFLFPFYAINRMFAKDIKQTKLWENKLNRCLGSNSWRSEIYKRKNNVQLSLFDGEQYESEFKKVDTNLIIEYVKKRLETIFPYVSPNPRIFKNEKNSILFVLFFMTSNSDTKAISLASKGAEYILKG